MAPPNWNTGEQIRDHKLAASIINGHGNEEYAVFDEPSLEKLERFVMDPSSSSKLMQEYGWGSGKAAADKGDLVGYLIGRHGTEDPAFDDRDLEMLKEWFGKGMPVGEHVER